MVDEKLLWAFVNTYGKEWRTEFQLIEKGLVQRTIKDRLGEFEITPLQKKTGYPVRTDVFWHMTVEENSWFLDNLSVMAAFGFRIYKTEEFGYIVGSDNVEAVQSIVDDWLPLYEQKHGCA